MAQGCRHFFATFACHFENYDYLCSVEVDVNIIGGYRYVRN